MAGKAYNFGGLRVVNDANPPYELYECSIFIHFPRTVVRLRGSDGKERPSERLKPSTPTASQTSYLASYREYRLPLILNVYARQMASNQREMRCDR
jgi:hypothetical protein